jgi:eukaryotic-like serine/threonine-protein kinase
MLKHFAIEETLGEGGMGIVYRARDTKLQRPVALKVLSLEVTTDTEKRKRFFQEARAAARMSHPAIAQVYDVDEDEGIVFIAMELVEGHTVRHLIQNKELDLLGAIDIAIQVAEGLAKAHEAGIVHRDIKPANVIVDKEGRAKILDFGLAKLMDPAPAPGNRDEKPADITTLTLTQIGTVMGTAAYMSPEQVKGGQIDFRSDIFSLGVMLFEMATWELPFRRGTPMETMHAVAFDETPSVHSLRSNLPPELQRIISKCLRKRPEDRYLSDAELIHDLKRLRRDTESGRHRTLSVPERLAEILDRARHLRAGQYLWLAAGALVLILLVYLSRSGVSKGEILFYGLAALIVYRHFRHRPRKALEDLVRKISRIPEVRLICSNGQQVTIVVDRPVAQLYSRIDRHLNECNRRLFFGNPLSTVIRHELRDEEVKALLNGPGVHYVRDDVLKSGQG